LAAGYKAEKGVVALFGMCTGVGDQLCHKQPSQCGTLATNTCTGQPAAAAAAEVTAY
jgi:hypothetical protein